MDCWLVLMLDSVLLKSEMIDADELFELHSLTAIWFMLALPSPQHSTIAFMF